MSPTLTHIRLASRLFCVSTNKLIAALLVNNRGLVVREYLASGLGKFRLADGHLPDYQPIASEVEALRRLDQNPFQGIVKLDK